MNKLFFAQNIMPISVITPDPDPEPDPGDPIMNPCAYKTTTHPRWSRWNDAIWGEDWFEFKSLPSGSRMIAGDYHYVGTRTFYWSATQENGTHAWRRGVRYSRSTVGRYSSDKRNGFSVRCVRDATPAEDLHVDGTEYSEDYEDGDGNKYDAVRIGDKVWTKKNLITTSYQNESSITTGLTDEQWEGTTDGAYAIQPHGKVDGINSEAAMIEAYGMLYNWFAVDGRLVDNDYRVPTDADWDSLTTHLIDEYGEDYNIDATNVATILKSCRQVDHPHG